MKKLLIAVAFTLPTLTFAGYFAQQSESYLVNGRNVGGNLYQCVYKTNPGNRGWRHFQVNFQGGCPRNVYYNAHNGNVTVP